MRLLIIIISLTLFSLSNQNIERPFLWKVTKGKQQFHLFGTMHLADPKLQILPKALKKVIDSSDMVRIEIALDKKTQRKASTMMYRSDSKKLQNILPFKLYMRLRKRIKKINPKINLKAFDKMKIWAVSSLVTTLENQLKYPKMRSIDSVIYDYTKSQRKDVRGVETLNEQLGVMDSFSKKEQILGLESSLDQLDTKVDIGSKMKELYMRGDSKDMLRFIDSMMFQMPKYRKLEEKFMKLLLYNRNLKMEKRIKNLLHINPQNKYLFAFGVMHFLGDRSVIELLERDGYRVMRVE